jgi:hypothetical protein
MNYYQDTVTGEVFAFELDVSAVVTSGVYTFKDARGRPINCPATLQPCPGNIPPTISLPAPTLAQQAIALLAGGLTITCTSAPAVSATYLCDTDSLTLMGFVVDSINTGRGFAGGGSTMDFDVAGGHVTFSSTTTFLDVAQAVRDFVYACNQVIRGRSTDLPANTKTIA